DDALAALDQEVKGKRGKTGERGGRGTGQSLSSALTELDKELKAGGSGPDAQGTGPGGSGGDGYGILGAYQDSIISRVRENWSWPGRTDRRNFTAVVNIQIASDGTIKSARLVSPSGNNFFDATVMRAIATTAVLEPPPHPGYSNIDISFSPEALAQAD
ncbi:TonB C-terminal domain-containing protein, partial [Desulfovibrio sp. OttesenSCG-928-A18]|nr:TonB C-terminal domain-containing protein [Desulfovibrio sp. OttesenSCG-928-A18]